MLKTLINKFATCIFNSTEVWRRPRMDSVFRSRQPRRIWRLRDLEPSPERKSW